MSSSRFVEQNRLTASGLWLIGQIDRHIAAKTGMTEELRHYAAAVYRTRLMKPAEWLAQYPDKAEALWTYLHGNNDERDSDEPPTSGEMPWKRFIR
jgi:hypothetical protein